VRLLFDADVAEHVKRKVYHPSQELEEREDGSVELSFEVAGLKDVRAWVRSWGPSVKVLEPERLARDVAADARAMMQRYGSSTEETSEDEAGDRPRPEA
jgi:predicted DNA-binding transcriptional regulator YafY